MKVYVAHDWVDFEGSGINGVYTTLEKAQQSFHDVRTDQWIQDSFDQWSARKAHGIQYALATPTVTTYVIDDAVE